MSAVRFDCLAARRRIHALLDGETLSADARGALDDHRSSCPECASFEAEMRELQRGLRALPQPGFPEDALDEVFARTSRAGAPRRRALDWRFAAAAAAVLALAIYLGVRPDHPEGPSATEIPQAREQARLVLELTASALDRSQRIAFDQVVVGEVSPALGRIPVRLPVDGRAAAKEGS